MALQGNHTPMCHFCLIPNPINNRTRQNVIQSTSTLSGVHYMEGWGWGDDTPLHCDMETVPGAKIIGRAEGLACADPGARTPIGASGNSSSHRRY